MAMKQVFTDGGYDLFEAISALQKTIRRGEEEAAMFWALELTPKYVNYLWQRLTVIVNEDIGLANPNAIVVFQALKTQAHEFLKAKRDGSHRLTLANAVLLLSRSPKSRLADEFQCVANQERIQHGKKLAIPDYAYDKHTMRGKRMGRGWAHFFEIGTHLVHPGTPLTENPYTERAKGLWQTSKKAVTPGVYRIPEEALPGFGVDEPEVVEAAGSDVPTPVEPQS